MSKINTELELSLYDTLVLCRLRAYYHFRTEITRKCGNNIEYYNIDNVGAGEAETGTVF